MEGNAQTLRFNVPERHIDGRKPGHQGRAVAPPGRHVIHAIPMAFRAGGILADVLRFQPAQHGFRNLRAALQRSLTDSGYSGVGLHFHKHQVPPAEGNLVDFKARNPNFSSSLRAGDAGEEWGGEALQQ